MSDTNGGFVLEAHGNAGCLILVFALIGAVAALAAVGFLIGALIDIVFSIATWFWSLTP